jgi:integrase
MRDRLPFQLFTRQGVFYFRVYNENLQKYDRVQTTGIKDDHQGARDAAIARASELVKQGRVPKRKDQKNALDYCIDRVRTSGSTRGHVNMSVSYLEKCRDFAFGQLSINQVSYQSLTRLIDDMQAAGFRPRRINQTISLIRAACKIAVKREYLTTDPFTKGIDKVPENLRERGALTLEEVKRTFTLEDEGDIRAVAFTVTALTTGCRRSELLGLTWADVSFSENSININKGYTPTDGLGKTKNESSVRTIPLFPPARDRLEKLRAASPFPGDNHYVFFGTAEEIPLAPSTASTLFMRTLTRIGLSPEALRARRITTHSARHSFITISRSVLSDYLTLTMTGQTNSKILNNYSHAGTDQFKQVKTALGELFTMQ